MSKDSEEDPGEDIDVGDEQSRDEPGDDVRCNDCHDSFPNLPSFLKHREACSGQDTAATGASLQHESGLKNTFLKRFSILYLFNMFRSSLAALLLYFTSSEQRRYYPQSSLKLPPFPNSGGSSLHLSLDYKSEYLQTIISPWKIAKQEDYKCCQSSVKSLLLSLLFWKTVNLSKCYIYSTISKWLWYVFNPSPC